MQNALKKLINQNILTTERTKPMKYEIINHLSGHNFGIYEADSEQEALEIMAKEAGYNSYKEACEVASPNGIQVNHLTPSNQ